MRLTVKEIAKRSGLCPETVRKHADAGLIPHARDLNNWRIFSEKSIRVAKQLAGVVEKKSVLASVTTDDASGRK